MFGNAPSMGMRDRSLRGERMRLKHAIIVH